MWTVKIIANGLLCLSLAASATGASVAPPASVSAATPVKPNQCPAMLDFQTRTLRGQPLDLCSYRGNVVLAVNTASYCGFTHQYQALEALHRKYKRRGLVVIGFPTNDFGAQEPGSNIEVAEFCERTFQVSFPMAEKSTLKDNGANPFLGRLAAASNSPAKWNFHKYLVDRTGTRVSAFGSKVAPDADEFVKKVEELLGAR